MDRRGTTALAAAAAGAALGCALLRGRRGGESSSSRSSSRSSSPAAELIDGKAIAASVRKEVAVEVAELVATYCVRPGLGVVVVGERRDSQTYVRNKKRAAEEVGFHSVDVTLPGTASEEEILGAIRSLNANSEVHAILVQLPLPDHVDEARVLREVAVDKDADGFSAQNFGNMCLRGGERPLALPCTPAGIVQLLQRSGVEVGGKRAVVVGRSNIVGTPCAVLLQQLDATVTTCHSRTRDIAAHVREADIVVAAVGRPRFVRGDWLKPGAVVVDVGINAVEDATKKRGYRLVGDVDFDSARLVASKITPVPGGVGPMTIAMLVRNTLDLARYHVLDKEAPPKVVSPARSRATYRMEAVAREDPVPPDIVVSQSVEPLPVERVAASAGLLEDEIELYGKHKAKVDAAAVAARLAPSRRPGSLVVVTGINPTKFGEGKSTTTIGVSQALGAVLGKRVVTTVRQPSQGPMFGIKGGAAGGGYSQVIPMEEMNSHLTGDIHAVVAANNLVAAALEARVFHERTQKDEALFNRLCPARKDGARPLAAPLAARLKRIGVTRPVTDAAELDAAERKALVRLDVDVETVAWKRVLDTCDRFLRKVEIGRNPTEKGQTRETGFDIAVASEIMAVLALATDAADLRARLGAMLVAKSASGADVTCDDLGVTGALTVLLKDALMPTLMQTLEGTPVLVHCGPFANIAHGNSSVVADRVALDLVGPDGFVVTEAGFGTDIGGEKNFDIKARLADLAPTCVVVVATVRALKSHGAGALDAGCVNVAHHVRCVVDKFRLPCVVAVNRFATDTDDEIALVRRRCLEAGATAAVEATHFARGGAGAVDLARALVDACAAYRRAPPTFRHLYPLDAPLRDKIATVCTEIYLAARVEYSQLAAAQLDACERDDRLNRLPICVAKTQYSLSTDPEAKGAPAGHTFYVRELKPSLGAGFVVVLAGDIMTIPGLPTRPNYYDIDLDTTTGKVLGLS
mmetsp:Transcript_13691/g.43245  ORF Transcript_13691/g.43245 Transcript_13691/m.43245 type:complete len:976 (-) Transcript_13691:375-3302(-)